MNLNEFNGNKLKRIFGADKAFFSYHNKHKRGSGNFGIILLFRHEGSIDVGCGMISDNRSLFDITGEYDVNKNIYDLHVGTLYQVGSNNISDMSFDEFVKYVKTYIEPIIEKNKTRKHL